MGAGASDGKLRFVKWAVGCFYELNNGVLHRNLESLIICRRTRARYKRLEETARACQNLGLPGPSQVSANERPGTGLRGIISDFMPTLNTCAALRANKSARNSFKFAVEVIN